MTEILRNRMNAEWTDVMKDRRRQGEPVGTWDAWATPPEPMGDSTHQDFSRNVGGAQEGTRPTSVLTLQAPAYICIHPASCPVTPFLDIPTGCHIFLQGTSSYCNKLLWNNNHTYVYTYAYLTWFCGDTWCFKTCLNVAMKSYWGISSTFSIKWQVRICEVRGKCMYTLD